jgi:hypothetical protein
VSFELKDTRGDLALNEADDFRYAELSFTNPANFLEKRFSVELGRHLHKIRHWGRYALTRTTTCIGSETANLNGSKSSLRCMSAVILRYVSR